jgi:hypothetical protein
MKAPDADKEALLRVHAGAINAQDLDTILGHYYAASRCIRDGELVGEGPETVRQTLMEDFRGEGDLVGRVMRLDGEPILIEWGGLEGRGEPRTVVRIEARGDVVREVRIDRDAQAVRDLVARATR